MIKKIVLIPLMAVIMLFIACGATQATPGSPMTEAPSLMQLDSSYYVPALSHSPPAYMMHSMSASAIIPATTTDSRPAAEIFGVVNTVTLATQQEIITKQRKDILGHSAPDQGQQEVAHLCELAGSDTDVTLNPIAANTERVRPNKVWLIDMGYVLINTGGWYEMMATKTADDKAEVPSAIEQLIIGDITDPVCFMNGGGLYPGPFSQFDFGGQPPTFALFNGASYPGPFGLMSGVYFHDGGDTGTLDYPQPA